MSEQENLFRTKDVPGKPGSGKLFEEEIVYNDRPVKCLGLEFENDDARRAYFTEELRKKLQDPEFRKIRGFPTGEDEDILKLSDPPYFTICPNPWLSQFIEELQNQNPLKTEEYQLPKEPFVEDVSEGKNDPIYKAHIYHTKVPHKAIMRYILHYTKPGDILFDGFCGTGMTAVAAQMCEDREIVESLGYTIDSTGDIYREETDEEGKKYKVFFSKLGARKVVLNDLSPVATFIAYNYNTPINASVFEEEAKCILTAVEKECGWMYETFHKDGQTKGKINYTVWSDVFICSNCMSEVVFFEVAVDKETNRVNKEFLCPSCNASLTKRNMERAWVTHYDTYLKNSIKLAKQVPVLINYTIGEQKFMKVPDEKDFKILSKIESSIIPYNFPTNKLMEGNETRRNEVIGITHMHHFYFKRGLWVLGCAYQKTRELPENIKRYILFTVQMAVMGFAKISRYRPLGYSQVNHYLSGTLYVGSQIVDISLPYILEGKIKRLANLLNNTNLNIKPVITTQDSSSFNIQDNSFDYIFIDPPFGANLYYSELNFLWESWLKVWTNNEPEAIVNSAQGKGSNEYRALMAACFKEAYRVLKPGRWMTVVFSNTKASVWNSIQTALIDAGFIVANVSALDKQQGSFKAVTTPTAVKQDLVISAYKPNGGFEERFKYEVQTEEGIWDFIRTHLKYLPVIKKQGYDLVSIPERSPRILYDQVISYYVRKGYNVPLDSQEFQLGLSQRFSERDGMFFLPVQVAEYDRIKMIGSGRSIKRTLFISDEASAIEWLRILIRDKPQSFQDINPQFMKEISGWSKNEVGLELSTLLEQNFLNYSGNGPVPEQIHSYLSTNWKDMRNLAKDNPELVAKAKDRWYVPDPNKAGDLERLRERALLNEFEEYKQAKKKLRIFRLEAIRAGFKKAWQLHDYKFIIAVAEKIPSNVLEEDPKLLMWYDQAKTRMGSL